MPTSCVAVMAQTTHICEPAPPSKALADKLSDPSIPPPDTAESPFLYTFLAAAPVAAEIISLLSTPQKQKLFSTCKALSEYRDSCYAWRSVTFTKDGYQPQTSFAKINYQIQARINSPGRYNSFPNEEQARKEAENKGWHVVRPIESYFCPQLDSTKIWDMLSLRPAFGSVLSELVLDGTAVDMEFVVKILAVCAVGGKGLKRLSVRYCNNISANEVIALMPKDQEENSDSGFESQSDDELEDDSVFRTLKELQIYGIRDLDVGTQDYREWLRTLDKFFKYTTEKKIRTDIGWCSQTLQGPKKRLRRPQCHGGKDLPFMRILALADTGSAREKHCMKCKKGPDEIGWHCDSCLKDVMCDVCGDFVCDNCDPKRSRLVKCGDCPSRRCSDCFENNGGKYCEKATCKKTPTCGAHDFEISCGACSESKEISCSSCNPATKCKRCTVWIYSHCDESKKKPAFRCNCDFELCYECCEDSKSKFIDSQVDGNSLEEIVYAINSSDYPIIPKQFKNVELRDNGNWCCFYCKIMPRRRERFTENRERSLQKSQSRRRSR